MLSIMEFKTMLNDSNVPDSQLRELAKEDTRLEQLYLEKNDNYFEEVSVFDFDSACKAAMETLEEMAMIEAMEEEEC